MLGIPGRTALVGLVVCCLARLALAADAPKTPKKPTLALLTVTSTDTSGAVDATAIEGLLLVGLEAGGRIQVTGRSDLKTLLGFEEQKQLLGCDSSSCVTELAGALGVDFVASADVGRLGDRIVVNLKVLDATKGVSVARASRQVESSNELGVAVDGLTREVTATILGDSSGTVRLAATIGGGVLTVVAVVVGAVLGSQSQALLAGDVKGTEGSVVTHTVTEQAALQSASLAFGANLCFGLGALLGIGTGVGFFLSAPPPPAKDGAGGGAGVVGVAGSF